MTIDEKREIRERAEEYLYMALDEAVSNNEATATVEIVQALNSFKIIDRLENICRSVSRIK